MKIRAFSIAEAFIMLLVVSVAIGLSAPMMTKQIKHNNLSSVRANLFEREIERLQRQINDLRIVVEENVVPQGTIAFFAGDCPSVGWSPVNADWNGRFPRFAGDYSVCDLSGENELGGCIGSVSSTITNNVGKFGGDTIRNVIGTFTNDTRSGSNESGPFSVTSSWGWGFKGGSAGSATYNMDMNLSRSVPTGAEVQPKSITLRGCIKN